MSDEVYLVYQVNPRSEKRNEKPSCSRFCEVDLKKRSLPVPGVSRSKEGPSVIREHAMAT